MDTDILTAPRPTAAEPGVVIAETEAFLDRCRDVAMHPDDVGHLLRRAGWDARASALAVESYRDRFDEHRLGYAAFLFAIGFSALSAGTLGHLLLGYADDRRPSPDAVSFWLTLLVIAGPLAAWAWTWLRKVDDTDPVAAWSRPRQTLARTLLWSCGVVGGFRLLHYVFTLIATITGASWADDNSPLVGLANVAVTVGITFPLGVWAFRFLHKFDR